MFGGAKAGLNLLLAGMALALSGCAMSPQLKRVAIDHNAMVAEAEDELTLLNIVRASQRFPLHFTTFSEVSGNAKLSVGGSLGAELAPGDDLYKPGVSAGVETAPSFKLGVLSTEKFQRGIQQPIGSDLVAYYLDAGWRDEMIMALFLERIEFVPRGTNGKPVATVSNDASQAGDFAKLLCNYRLISEPTAASRPLASFEQLFDKQIVADKEKKAAERRSEIAQFLDLLGREDLTFQGETLFLKGSRNSANLERLPESRCAKGEAYTPPEGDLEAKPRFRSTLGIIYFLGEYSREAQRAGLDAVYGLPFTDVYCAMAIRSRPLIDIRTGSGSGLIDAHFRGERYYIPETDELTCDGPAPARGVQVVAMIQQLLNLHKSSDELPSSLSISGIN